VLRDMLCTMITHGYVPDGFGEGSYCPPIVQDKSGNKMHVYNTVLAAFAERYLICNTLFITNLAEVMYWKVEVRFQLNFGTYVQLLHQMLLTFKRSKFKV